MRALRLTAIGMAVIIIVVAAGDRGAAAPAAKGATPVVIPSPNGAADTRFRFSAETEKATYDCRTIVPTKGKSEDLLGSVIEARIDGFVLDSCPPTADCLAHRKSTYTVKAVGFSGFDRLLPLQSFVRVRIDMRRVGNSCLQQLTVSSIGSWLGAPNPGTRLEGLMFAGADSVLATGKDTGFAVELCPVHSPPGSIQVVVDGGKRSTIEPAQTARWRRTGAEFEIRNVSSPHCEDTAASYWTARSLDR